VAAAAVSQEQVAPAVERDFFARIQHQRCSIDVLDAQCHRTRAGGSHRCGQPEGGIQLAIALNQ